MPKNIVFDVFGILVWNILNLRLSFIHQLFNPSERLSSAFSIFHLKGLGTNEILSSHIFHV